MLARVTCNPTTGDATQLCPTAPFDRRAMNEFVDYVNAPTAVAEVRIVAASSQPFIGPCSPLHREGSALPPDTLVSSLKNRKVRGVPTGLRYASHNRVIIADDESARRRQP
jgi:hypothetical protein